ATLPRGLLVSQRGLNIDGMASTQLYKFDGHLRELEFLRYDVTNLAYFLPDRRTGAVIGVGGGRDMLAAKLFGVDEVTGVEVNPTFVKFLTDDGSYAGYTRLASLPGVRFVVDDARSWFARSTSAFDVIQMSLIDTFAATGAGAYSLSENGLYTEEAWTTFTKHLTDRGVFTVSRWYAPGAINEAGRMVSLGMATLFNMGVAHPADHLYVATAAGRIATLILSRSPLAARDVAALDAAAARYQYDVIAGPGHQPASPVLTAIVGAPDVGALARFTAAQELDMSPPTDERPFFFNQLRL